MSGNVLEIKMADRILFFFLATLVFETNAQICGCGGPGPLCPGPIVPQLAPAMPCMGPMVGPQPIITEPYFPGPPIIPQQVIATPQPLCATPQPLCAAPPPLCAGPQPYIAAPQPIIAAPPCIVQPYPNVVAATVVDNTLSNSLANAIQLLIVSNLIENTLNSGLYPGGIVNLCDSVINPGPCVDFTEIIPVAQSIVPTCVCESPILETVGPIYGCDMPVYANYAIPEPIQPIYNPVVPTMAPVAAEVLFPSAIPAQLTCNFGYMNTNVPCVSVNVEPLPSFDSCNPYFNNGYFY
ncbi:calphotin [Manduca sexta]|uniref:calphotin n=1 Tax=Manduca sexta TaxID=7130 RepID=UPI00188EDC57|nr:calphotin [Manduca sexta]